MKKHPGNGSQRPKRAYVKPQVRAVELRPDEAVLGNCKTTNRAGPASPASCTTPVSCSKKGS